MSGVCYSAPCHSLIFLHTQSQNHLGSFARAPIHPHQPHFGDSADAHRQRRQSTRKFRFNAKIVCLMGNSKGGQDKDAALRALENALGGKKDAFNRWDEEIKKREAARGGDGNRGGGGWFGGGWFGGFESEDSWKEIQQAIYAMGGLLLLYLLLVKGEAMISVPLNAIVFFLRGFRESYESILSGRFKMRPTPKTDNKSPSKAQHTASGSAIENVIRKWGPD